MTALTLLDAILEPLDVMYVEMHVWSLEGRIGSERLLLKKLVTQKDSGKSTLPHSPCRSGQKITIIHFRNEESRGNLKHNLMWQEH